MRASAYLMAAVTVISFAAAPLAPSLTYGQQKTGAFEELVRRVPGDANAIVLFDVEKAVASPYGKKMEWQNKLESAFMSGMTMVAPGATQVVEGMHLDLDRLEPTWETAVLRLKHEPDADAVAKLYMGSLDKFGEYPAVDLPGNAYAVKFGKNVAGVLGPATRQTASRWVRETDSNKGPNLSPYLMEAYRFANDLGTPMIVALDLEDVPEEGAVREALSTHEALKDAKVDIDALAKSLSSIRGVTLGVTLADKPFAKLKVDFRENINLSPELAKALLITALEKRGAELVELEDWKPVVSGKTISLEGHLTASGIRRLSSLFNKPPMMPSEQQFAEQKPPEQIDPEQQKIQASQLFFKHVTDLLADLRQKPKRSRNHTTGQIGVWAKSYASKIDQLSTLNVDPELVEFAEAAANALRDVHSTLATGAANARLGALNAAVPYDTFSSGQTWGYSMWGGAIGTFNEWSVPNVRGYQHNRTRARTEARLGAATNARGIMDNLDSALASMRNKMTQKYNVQF